MENTQNNETDNEFGLFTKEAIYKEVPDKEVIIEGMLSQGDNLVISSKAGTGKTVLALQFIFALTSGHDFLETYHIPKPRKVLYVQTEGDRSETIGRLKRMKRGLKINDDMWAHYNAVGITLNTPEGLNEFLEVTKRAEMAFDVIIIDPLYSTIKGSISDDAVATDWQRSVRIIRAHFPKVAYVVFHHDSSKELWVDRKRVERAKDDLMGSTMWGAWMSANYKLIKVGEDEEKKRILHAGKGDGFGRTGQGVSEVHMRMVEPSPLLFIIDETDLNDTETKVWVKMNADPQKKFTRKQLEVFVGKSKATVCRALVSLLTKGLIEKTEEDGVIYYGVKASSD